MLSCCITSLLTPDATGARGKEVDVTDCAQATVAQLTATLSLERCWTPGMLSDLRLTLERVYKLALNRRPLLIDDLLHSAQGATPAGAEDANSTETAQRLEVVSSGFKASEAARILALVSHISRVFWVTIN